MSTRCLTIFMDDETEIAVMYRHCDGYPAGHGHELAEFLMGKIIVNGIGTEDNSTIFNGMGCLAASVVAHFKDGPGNIYLYPAGTRDVWEDYTYIVSRQNDGAIPIIEVKDEGFKGPASAYQDWLEQFEKENEEA